MKKYLTSIVISFMLVVALSGCGSRSKVVYLQDASQMGEVQNMTSYSARIKCDDQLSIIVNSQEPELAAPFNMELNQRAFIGGGNVSSTYNGGTPQVFWVDAAGNISYPTIGKLHVEGMTRTELADYLENYLKTKGYIQDPIVNVTFYNYRFSVLGEVNRPGQFSVTHDRVTLFDAIAMAGDLTIYGERDKVRLVRDENGVQRTYTIDLRDPTLLTSPQYYIHQNDLLYIEPNKSKASNREVSSLYSFAISLTSLALSVATFIKLFN